MTEKTPALEARNITVRYGGIAAVDDVSIAVAAGEFVGLLGPNGAGKTTLLEVLSGSVRPKSGAVLLHGTDITTLAEFRRARAGIARGFQDALLYPSMTVADCLRTALDRSVADSTDLTAMLLALPSARAVERALDARAERLAERFGITRWYDATIGELSTGTRRIVELAGVFATDPKVVLLDEPTAGIAQAETGALRDRLSSIVSETGVSVVLVEHDVALVLSLSDRVYVMAGGALLATGTPHEIAADDRVIEAYFGRRPTLPTPSTTKEDPA